MSFPCAGDEAPAVCVIFNPSAGKSQARQRLEAIRAALDGRFELSPTEWPGHATRLAREAAERGFKTIVAAGGDGTVHEVANGILQSDRVGVCLGILPLGSANDYAFSLRQEQTERAETGGSTVRLVDIGRLRLDSEEPRYFVCCLGIGFSGSVTGESRTIPRLQGTLLYGMAAACAMWRHWQHLDLRLQLDGQPPTEQPTLMVSFMIGRREGGFMMAPDARLDDGDLRVIQAGRLSRWEVLRLLPRLVSAGPPTSHPKLSFARCRTATVTARQPLSVHVDGEILCRPEDRVFRLEVEILAARLPVQIIDPKLTTGGGRKA